MSRECWPACGCEDEYDPIDEESQYDPGEAARAERVCQCGEFETCIGGCGAELDKDDDDDPCGQIEIDGQRWGDDFTGCDDDDDEWGQEHEDDDDECDCRAYDEEQR